MVNGQQDACHTQPSPPGLFPHYPRALLLGSEHGNGPMGAPLPPSALGSGQGQGGSTRLQESELAGWGAKPKAGVYIGVPWVVVVALRGQCGVGAVPPLQGTRAEAGMATVVGWGSELSF